MEKLSPLREVPTPSSVLLITPEAGSGVQGKAPSPTPGHQLSSGAPGLYAGQCPHWASFLGTFTIAEPTPSASHTHTCPGGTFLFIVVMCLGAIDRAGAVCFLGYDWWKPGTVYSTHCDFGQEVTKNGLRPQRDGVDTCKKIRVF